MTLQHYTEQIKAGDVDLDAAYASMIEQSGQINQEYHYFTNFVPDYAKQQVEELKRRLKAGDDLPLAGVFVSVKDCICVQDIETTAGSEILKGYKPVFDATVIKRLKKAGAIIIGKTVQDAFGFGSFSTNVGKCYSIPKNPVNQDHVCGGSSGGAAGLTRLAPFTHAGIGQSTGGSIVCPASFCGVVGLCPTYSLVSRNGLISYSNTLDKIGPFAKTVEDCALVLETMKGFDPMDNTSSETPDITYSDFTKNKETARTLTIGIIKEYTDPQASVDDKIQAKVTETIEQLKEDGISVKEVSLPFTTTYALPAYYLVAMTEASTNLAALCGLRYGKQENPKDHFNDYFTSIRTKHFNDETKRRIILGTFARMAGFREAYYIRALKIRTKIIEEYKKLFSDVDILCAPTMPFQAPTFEEVTKLSPAQEYMADNITAAPNLAGLPHLSLPLPVDKKELPIGLLLIGDHFQEKKVLDLAYYIQQTITQQ